MIKVTINSTDVINSIEIKGHSGYSTSGYDIVCASVSSIAITTVNAVISISKNAITYKEDNGYLLVNINNHSSVVDKLINNMISLLEEMEKQYKKYIEIRRCHR